MRYNNIVWVLWIFLFSSRLGVMAQSSTDMFVKRTTSGTNIITLPKKDLTLAPLLYLEKKQNNIYESFWVSEGLTSPEDMYVRLVPAKLISHAYVVVFSISPKLLAYDPDLEIHGRISEMMYDFFRPYTKQDNWITWMSGVEYDYNNDRILTNEANNARFELIDPKADQLREEELKDSIAISRVSVTAQEYAWQRLRLAAEDLIPVYRSFLNISGLDYGLHAEIDIRIDSVRANAILLFFTLQPEAVKADPEFSGHNRIAKTFVDFLYRKSEPFRPEWLILQAKADTSNYRRLPIILYNR